MINETLKKNNNDKLKIEYDKIIKKADDYFTAKNYKLARDFYKQASSFEISNGVNFSNGYAYKIISIDQLISEESNSKIDDQKQKAVQEKYDLMLQKLKISNQNQLLKSKEFFARASKLYPSESLPKQRITEIDQLIMDQLEKEIKVSTIVIYQKLINFLQIKIMTSLFLFSEKQFLYYQMRPILRNK